MYKPYIVVLSGSAVESVQQYRYSNRILTDLYLKLYALMNHFL